MPRCHWSHRNCGWSSYSWLPSNSADPRMSTSRESGSNCPHSHSATMTQNLACWKALPRRPDNLCKDSPIASGCSRQWPLHLVHSFASYRQSRIGTGTWLRSSSAWSMQSCLDPCLPRHHSMPKWRSQGRNRCSSSRRAAASFGTPTK